MKHIARTVGELIRLLEFTTHECDLTRPVEVEYIFDGTKEATMTVCEAADTEDR